jgi:hypothetical protein
MIKNDELVTMKAIAICFKPYLKPEEAMIYCNLGRTQLTKICNEAGVYKNNSGYYKKDELDKMLSGADMPMQEAPKNFKLGTRTEKNISNPG